MKEGEEKQQRGEAKMMEIMKGREKKKDQREYKGRNKRKRKRKIGETAKEKERENQIIFFN